MAYDKAKFHGPGNGKQVVDFINNECPPLTWNMVAVKLMGEIVKANLKALHIGPSDEFPDSLLISINNLLKSDYGKELPL